MDGNVVRTATGPNVQPGGSEALEPAAWDVSEFQGTTARIEVIDRATGGWGHINLDHVVFTDTKPAAGLAPAKPRTRDVVAANRFLNFPVKNGARARPVKVLLDGQIVREFTIEAADDSVDWWASLDVSAWKGKPLTIVTGPLPASSKFVEMVDQGDTVYKAGDDLYREALRPQFHFSPRRGWNNDPNGLVYYNGEYHLFFQFNPYGTQWGNMHWGHAVSRDLVRWEELGIALYPDRMGPMFSGSAVVDWNNTSGFGKDGRPPLILIYTAAGNPTTQCLAWSQDGRTFTKYERNPVLRQITPGNRDPKVFWHEPTRRWVMTLYVGFDQPPAEAGKRAQTKHTIQILTSPDLKEWDVTGQVDGFFECPDLFPLPVDADASKTRWLLTAASSEYMLGRFDGRTFIPETPKLKGHLGQGFYAAQTFSDVPAADGRRIMIGWLRAPSPGMPFNQAMSLPLELRLTSTEAGPRLTWAPARELETLRATSQKFGPMELKPGDDPLRGVSGELLEVRAELTPAAAGAAAAAANSRVTFTIRGVPLAYDAASQELSVAGHRAPAPLRDGKLRLIILADRTVFEVFAADGLAYVPVPVIPKADDKGVSLSVTSPVQVQSIEVHALKSAWRK
jgi:sucrose-6-phosphate hydrolase SacC (GH32 family)